MIVYWVAHTAHGSTHIAKLCNAFPGGKIKIQSRWRENDDTGQSLELDKYFPTKYQICQKLKYHNYIKNAITYI
jgi:hypothetical protein